MANATTTALNYSYFVDYVRSFPNWREMRVLDYGCGAGDTVVLLRDAGVNAIGCDTFYAGNGHRGDSAEAELLRRKREGIVVEVPESGDLPFPTGHFDLILTNQVFEHVTDIEATLDRLDKVLAPDGLMCHHFPSRQVIREGHIGIPLAHWFRKGAMRGTARWYWTLALRWMGLGHHKRPDQSEVAWTEQWLTWIDQYCVYRPTRELLRTFRSRYRVATDEMRYIRFRARRRPFLALILRADLLAPFARVAFRRLAFHTFELRPKARPSGHGLSLDHHLSAVEQAS